MIHVSSSEPLGAICEKFKFSKTRFLGFSHKECIAALLPMKAFAASLQSEGNYGGQTEGSNSQLPIQAYLGQGDAKNSVAGLKQEITNSEARKTSVRVTFSKLLFSRIK